MLTSCQRLPMIAPSGLTLADSAGPEGADNGEQPRRPRAEREDLSAPSPARRPDVDRNAAGRWTAPGLRLGPGTAEPANGRAQADRSSQAGGPSRASIAGRRGGSVTSSGGIASRWRVTSRV